MYVVSYFLYVARDLLLIRLQVPMCFLLMESGSGGGRLGIEHFGGGRNIVAGDITCLCFAHCEK